MTEFSVVIATYERAEFLGEAIDSVLCQEFDDFECIVVDDASRVPPRLPDDARLRLIRREQNGGPAATRNTGIDSASGRYVAFLDDDDVWHPRRLAAAAAAHARAPVAACRQTTLGTQAAPTGRDLEGDVRDTILDGLTPHLGATSIERVRAPRFDERYDACEDVDWWLRVAQSATVTTIAEAHLFYRRHDQPRGRTGQEARIAGSRMLLDEHAAWFRDHPRALAFRLKRMGLTSLRLGDAAPARRYFAASLRLRPEPSTAWHLLRSLPPSALRGGARM